MLKRAFAEFFGTGVLVSVVVGSGTMATNISQDAGVQLLINTVARAFSDTFSGIKLSSVSGFVGAQIIGALIGYALVLYLTSEKAVNHE